VQPAWAWNWLQALREAQGLSADAPVCAVQGPRDASYRQRDIDTAALVRHLASSPPGRDPVTVVAHSSGSFVAQHWLRQMLAAGQRQMLARVHYYNLDGDIGEGEHAIDAALIATLAQVHAVYAVRASGDESANAAAMRALHALAPQQVRLHALAVPDSGCKPKARWCLHDALIRQHPHDPGGFNLEHDYGGLDARHPVQSSYLVR